MSLRISDEVLFQEVSGEAVLLDLKSEQYFGLDKVGTHVWQLLNQNLPEESIIEQLLQRYEVDRPTLENDVGQLLAQLEKAGLVERA